MHTENHSGACTQHSGEQVWNTISQPNTVHVPLGAKQVICVERKLNTAVPLAHYYDPPEVCGYRMQPTHHESRGQCVYECSIYGIYNVHIW